MRLSIPHIHSKRSKLALLVVPIVVALLIPVISRVFATSYPTTSVLDNFNRADETLGTPNWLTNPVANVPNVSGNQFVSTSAGQTWAAWHTLYSLPVESWVQVAQINDPSDFSSGFSVKAGIQAFTGGGYDQDYTGYTMIIYPASDDATGLGHYDLGYGGNYGDGKLMDQDVTGHITVSIGDYFGIRVEALDGTTARISGWQNNGSGWTQIDHLDVAITTLAGVFPSAGGQSGYSQGYIAPVVFSTDYALDNFGGGTGTSNSAPAAPTLSAPSSGATGISTTPQFQLRTTDADNDYLRYRIYLYQSNCTTAVGSSPFTEPSGTPQTGWSGQDQQSSTAYTGNSVITSSTTATYTYQGTLSANTTYCWKADAIDPGGGNTYSTASTTRLFTTNQTPSAPTLSLPANSATGIARNPTFSLSTTDTDSDYLQYEIQVCSTSNCSSVVRTICQNALLPNSCSASQSGWGSQNTQSGTAYTGGSSLANSQIAAHSYLDPALLPSTQYWWRAYAIDPGGTNSASGASSIFSFTTGTSELQIKGGIQIKGGTKLAN